MFEISDFFDVSALSTVLEERLMSIHDVQLAINALRIVKPLDVCHRKPSDGRLVAHRDMVDVHEWGLFS